MRKNELDFFDSLFEPFINPSIFDKALLTPLKVNQMPTNVMKTDIKEKDNEYIIDIDVPGIAKEDLSITLSEGYLTIMATKEEKKEEEDCRYIRQERYYGSRSRKFYVGEQIEESDISATFDNGVLELTIPKKEAPQPEKKTITIN